MEMGPFHNITEVINSVLVVCHFDVVGRLACFKTPRAMWAAASALRRCDQTQQVSGVGARQKTCPGPPGWGLG